MNVTINFRRFLQRKLAVLLCLAMVLTLLPAGTAKADTDTGVVGVTEYGGELRLTAGGSAQLQVADTVVYGGMSYAVSSYTFTSYNEEVATVDQTGAVKAVHTGTTEIVVQVNTKQSLTGGWGDSEGYDQTGNDGWDTTDEETTLFEAYYDVTVLPDLSHVKINKTSQTGYTANLWGDMQYTFKLKSAQPLTEDDDLVVLSYSSSNPDVRVSASLENNVLTITPYDAGKTTVTVSLNDQKLFKLKIQTILVNLTANSALMTPGQTKQLRVKGGKNLPVKWSSSDKSIVSVSSDGKLTARKNGNAVIKATVGDCAFGCAVSVVSPSRKQAINRAIYIAQTCTYSQPYRMQEKYYDCSSLVWKAYSKIGTNFGGSYYAPVAADIGKWCVTHHKTIKGGVSQTNVNQMKLNAGDLMFETGAENGRYRGIYHVEMITGYSCQGFDRKGRPYLLVKWASKPDGYYYPTRQMVGRP